LADQTARGLGTNDSSELARWQTPCTLHLHSKANVRWIPQPAVILSLGRTSQSRPSQLNEIGKKVKITHVNPRSVRLSSNPGVTAGGAP